MQPAQSSTPELFGSVDSASQIVVRPRPTGTYIWCRRREGATAPNSGQKISYGQRGSANPAHARPLRGCKSCRRLVAQNPLQDCVELMRMREEWRVVRFHRVDVGAGLVLDHSLLGGRGDRLVVTGFYIISR
jgi:hypothetical protein